MHKLSQMWTCQTETNTNQNKACKHKRDPENEEDRENSTVPSVKQMWGCFSHTHLHTHTYTHKYAQQASFSLNWSDICLCPLAVGPEGARCRSCMKVCLELSKCVKLYESPWERWWHTHTGLHAFTYTHTHMHTHTLRHEAWAAARSGPNQQWGVCCHSNSKMRWLYCQP